MTGAWLLLMRRDSARRRWALRKAGTGPFLEAFHAGVA